MPAPTSHERPAHAQRATAPAALVRSVRDLPKVHVHAHLDGSYPRAAVQRLARAQGADAELPTTFRDVWHFFDAYGTVPALVRTLDDLADLCRALVEQEAAQGVRYLEPAVEPQLYAPRLGSLADVTVVVMEALLGAAADTGLEVGVMITINTDEDEALADDLARLAADLAGAGVSALGTAGFVEPAGLHRFSGAAATARAAGLPVVAHAGQTGGPDSVREALDALGARRLSHGVRSAADADLLARLAAEGVVCDVCPVSNARLGVVPSLAEHPAPRLLQAGVPVTLNADDQLWFGASVSDQYTVARDVWGMDDAALASVAACGALVTGMSPATRERLRTDIDRWLAADATADADADAAAPGAAPGAPR